MDFDNVSVKRRAEILHGGRASRRSIITADGDMKSLGLVLPGNYRFTTQAAETLEVTAGHCRVKRAEDQAWVDCGPGQSIAVPANSYFEMEADEPVDYVCHYGV
ncbi:MAG TPA: pyrimidine/purine nucleoside phosphorylase [Gammaproteobacteria bacterium]|nr:pyrimidine/purine nucleoside phosphorylase [Gammaproteobacteria bacterium]